MGKKDTSKVAPEVQADSSYDNVEKALGAKPAWRLLDEDDRREVVGIFVRSLAAPRMGASH